MMNKGENNLRQLTIIILINSLEVNLVKDTIKMKNSKICKVKES